MQCIVPIPQQRQSHPNEDKDEFVVTKKRLAYTADRKNPRSMDMSAHAVI